MNVFPDKRGYEEVGLNLVLNIVVTCGEVLRPSPNSSESKDGSRTEIWPILGGRFDGPGIHGHVEPGGADLPVTRPDGVEVVDAFYRLLTDDGETIIIHNKGLTYSGDQEKYRLAPEFIAPVGKYDWLNKYIFVATLISPVPSHMQLAGDGENDRLIQVYKVS